MKHLYTFLIGCISLTAFAQTTPTVGDFKLNFAVPDNPAFKILGKDPSNILRPANLEELTTTISDLNGGSSLVLPESFALEISPNLLKNRKLELDKYNSETNLLWRTLRISLGTSRTSEDMGRTDLGVGLRFSIINEGEYKTDSEYQNELDKILKGDVRLRQILAEEYFKCNEIKRSDLARNPDLEKQQLQYIDDKIKYTYKDFVNAQIDSLKKEFEDKNWNAQKLDFAAAARGLSPDSLAKNVEFKAFSVWLTYANGKKWFDDWGQILFGVNYKYDELNIERNSLLSFNSRFYVGKNRLKGFAEAQYEIQSFQNQNAWLLNTGFEINIVGNLWADVSFGWEYMEADENIDGSAFKSDFDINYRF